MQKITTLSEIKLVLIIGLVQFVDILDFMIVMPLGPDYSSALGIRQSELGKMAFAYTVSAAISGILSATIIDRFARKKALIFCMTGLVSATIACGFANSLEYLLITRFIAGLFGGQTSALSMAIIADIVVPQRRGIVIGRVMTAFSLAATIGVPFGLEVSRFFGWQKAFFAVAIIGIIGIIVVTKFLPHIHVKIGSTEKSSKITYSKFFKNNLYIITFINIGIGMMASFMIIPYISAYLQFNLDFPRRLIALLYFIGGVASFVTVQIIGKVVDQRSSYHVIILSMLFVGSNLIFGYIYPVSFLSIYLVFPAFMVGMSMRNVATSALISKIPKSNERAGFMALISMFQHVFSSFGSYLTSMILVQNTPNSPMQYMNITAITALILFTITPIITKYIESKLK